MFRMSAPPRSIEVVDLLDDSDPDGDHAPPGQGSEEPIDKSGDTHATESLGERTSAQRANDLYHGYDHWLDYEPSGALPESNLGPQYVSPSALTHGMDQASSKLAAQPGSQNMMSYDSLIPDSVGNGTGQNSENNGISDPSAQQAPSSALGEAGRSPGTIEQKDATWRSAKGDPTKFEADRKLY